LAFSHVLILSSEKECPQEIITAFSMRARVMESNNSGSESESAIQMVREREREKERESTDQDV